MLLIRWICTTARKIWQFVNISCREIPQTDWFAEMHVFAKKISTSGIFKACVRYFFIKFLFFHQIIALQKLWKMFISSKKVFLFSRYSIFCYFFPFLPEFPDSKGQMEVGQFLMSWIGLHKFVDVIFGVTQNPLYITSSNLVR